MASSGNGGKHSTKTDPGTIHENAANGFITPLILANYNDQTGDTYIDYVKITEFNAGGGSTVISGDTIKTGNIKFVPFTEKNPALTHVNTSGEANIVDITHKWGSSPTSGANCSVSTPQRPPTTHPI